MRVEDVEARIAEIMREAGDPETQHAMEDSLYADVLAEIVRQGLEGRQDADPPHALSEAALKTRELEFPRWCA